MREYEIKYLCRERVYEVWLYKEIHHVGIKAQEHDYESHEMRGRDVLRGLEELPPLLLLDCRCEDGGSLMSTSDSREARALGAPSEGYRVLLVEPSRKSPALSKSAW